MHGCIAGPFCHTNAVHVGLPPSRADQASWVDQCLNAGTNPSISSKLLAHQARFVLVLGGASSPEFVLIGRGDEMSLSNNLFPPRQCKVEIFCSA